MTRCMALLLAGALALVAVATAFPRAEAQTLPLPPLPELPAPPVDGSVLSDALGPLATDYCDTVATVYALAGPIASAQLPPELRALVDEVTPYLSVVTYACGLLVSPPTGVVCATDDQLAQQLGVLGLPLSAPTPVQVLHDTAAGIEHVFLRAGIDIGPDVSRQLALILGCGVAPEVEPPPAAAAPVPAVDEPPPPASA
ncbi:MAG: hypothetical protein M3Z03_13575, partial [Actinomycetota bacterium]|nr:hypothetical protein [Actinomycetota bacterium]